MSFPLHQPFQVRDAQGRDLGQMVADRRQADGVSGSFGVGPDYPSVEGLFAEHHEAVNQQLFSRVDELDAAIDALGVRLVAADGAAGPGVRDVQIGAGRISFRLAESSAGPAAPTQVCATEETTRGQVI